MKNGNLLQRAVLAVLAGALPAGVTLAQDTAGSASIGEVVVTGSRIARPDLDSNSPISVVDESFFKQKGTMNVEEVLNQLPQVVPGLGAQVNNGGDGTATVDLRGLGPTRTLVLINGRRFVPATNTGRTDLNAIPANLIKRIEVVTGGASAVYGSDALSGVVNFILKDDFEGVELATRFGQSAKSDSDTKDASILIGGNFAEGRGNAVVAATYYKRNPTYQDARDFSRIDLQGAGSATGIAGRLDNSPFNPYGAFGGNTAGKNYAFNADGTPRVFVNQLPEENGGVGDRYNFSPVNYLQTPQTRTTLDAFVHYDLTEKTQAYAELYYIQNRALLNLAPTPATNLVLPITNPLLTQATRDLLATRPNPTAPAIFRRRMVEFGPRVNDNKFDTSQLVTGIKGELPLRDWKWDTYYSYGRTDQNTGIRGDISRERLNASLAGCPTGPGTIQGCRVVDFFGPGKLTDADVNFLRIASAVDTLRFERHLFQANLSGSVADLPAGKLGTAIGVEWREDSSNFQPSEASLRGDLSGFNPLQPIAGRFDVKEAFAEANLPILADAPAAKYLGLDAAVRFSDYSTVGNLFSWKTGLEWRPIEQLKFRSTYAKANRAPSVFELFQAGDTNSPTVTDPCALIRANGAPQTVSAATRTICQLSGLPGAGTLPAQTNSQVTSLRVGNPNLKEETGTTLTAGLVWTPPYIENFSMTFDYFDIKVDGYVSRLSGGESGLVAGCFSSGVTTAAEYAADPNCRNIAREPNGELLITAPLVNSSTLKTQGYDLAVNYALDVENVGRFTARFDTSYTDTYKLDGSEYAGQTSSDFGTIPNLRGNLRLVYDRGPFQASVNWNYIGPVDERPGDGGDTRVGAWSYTDLYARYTFAEKYDLSAGVTNVFDKTPPVILTGFTNTNTDNTTYDTVGRRFFVGVNARF